MSCVRPSRRSWRWCSGRRSCRRPRRCELHPAKRLRGACEARRTIAVPEEGRRTRCSAEDGTVPVCTGKVTRKAIIALGAPGKKTLGGAGTHTPFAVVRIQDEGKIHANCDVLTSRREKRRKCRSNALCSHMFRVLTPASPPPFKVSRFSFRL